MGTWCRWLRAIRGRLKLNIDGSTRIGDITGGSVIRDEIGNLVASFSYYYGQGTIMLAEFKALHDGLSLCNAMEIGNWILNMIPRWWLQLYISRTPIAGHIFRFFEGASLIGGRLLRLAISFAKLIG